MHAQWQSGKGGKPGKGERREAREQPCLHASRQQWDRSLGGRLSQTHTEQHFWLRLEAASIKSGLMELRKVRANCVSGSRRRDVTNRSIV